MATTLTFNPLTGTFDVILLATANVQTWLVTPSSANLLAALSDKTGTGLNVFNNTPTLIAPLLGTPTSGTLTNCTGLPEGGLSLTDITTNDVSATKHGFAPKFPNNTTTFLRGDGTYAAPASSGVTSIATTSPISGGTITGTGTLSLLVNTDFLFTANQSVTKTVGVTSADGLMLVNSTAAAAGAQQWSPRLRLTGQGWKTTATAASETVDWVIENQPVQGTADPTTNLVISSQINGAGYTANAKILSNGQFQSSFTSVSAPSYSFVGDTTTGWGYRTGGTLSAIISGAESLRINSSAVDALSIDIGASNGGRLYVGSGGTADVFLVRAAAAVLQLGSNVNGAAISQQLQAANGITGTDKTGGNLTIASGKGTGAGAVSSIILQTPTVLTTGTTAQSLATRLTLDSSGATFAGKVTLLGGATFLTTSSALTDGVGASAGTITNAPSVGNPTKWIGINDNGTVRYIPAW